MKYLVYRFPWFILHLLLGLVLAIGLRITYGKQWILNKRVNKTYCWWIRVVAKILGLEISMRGVPSQGPMIYVANHISWIDILALSTQTPISFVAKSDVRRWPVIGWLAQLSGTIFIDRSNKRAMVNAIDKIKKVIHDGHIVVIFPESTTTNGSYLHKFHSGLFEAAIQSSVPVQPISIRFKIGSDPDYRIAPYIDDDNFISHLLRFMKSPSNGVSIHYLTPISSIGASRTTLCERCRTNIESDLFAANVKIKAA